MKDPRLQQDIWDRASFEANTRPIRAERDVSRADLQLPHGPSKGKMLALTFVGAVGMTVLYVLAPATAVVLASGVHLPARWFWVGIGAAAVGFWVLLFTLAVRESAADRRYAERLALPG
jgi:hypothetical protein